MLPKQHRLPLRTELTRVKKVGRVFAGRFFGLLVAPQSSKAKNNSPRLAFIVSKKIHSKSSQRNRVRRLLIEAIRPFLPEIRPGFDFVILAKKTILGRSLRQLEDEARRILKDEKTYFKAD